MRCVEKFDNYYERQDFLLETSVTRSPTFIISKMSYLTMADEHLQATVSVRAIVIEPRGRLLILQRSTDSEWELPGGRLAPDEDPMQGLERELAEETGLSVEIDDIVAANSWVNDDNQDRFAVHYRCYAPQEELTLSNEHGDAQWITRSDTDKLLSEPQMAAVRAATGPIPVQSEAADRSSASRE